MHHTLIGAPIHGHFTFWTKFWDRVRVSRTPNLTRFWSTRISTNFGQFCVDQRNVRDSRVTRNLLTTLNVQTKLPSFAELLMQFLNMLMYDDLVPSKRRTSEDEN